jgi:SPOR domain
MAGFGFRAAAQGDPNQLERPDATLPGRGGTGRDPTQPSSVGLPRLTKIAHGDERETTDGSTERLRSVDADDFRMSREQGLAPAAVRGRWRLTPKGLALVGVVGAVGLVLVLRCALSSGLFVDSDPANKQFPADKAVAERSDPSAPSGKDGAQLAQSKVDLSTQAPLAPPPAGGSGVRKIQAPDGVSDTTAVAQKVGEAIGARASSAQQSIDATPTGSTGWAVQLAASKSEDEAKNDLKRLNDRYASELNGSTIRLHKARVDGETVYRLRAVGLSKAGATALCQRLKGDGGSCVIVR